MPTPTALPPLPPRPHDGHKGTFGRVLILGGSDPMIGAPAFAGSAALRTGSGLVQIATPASILPFSLSICPELIGLPLTSSSNHKPLLDAAEKATSIVIGPGLGQSPQSLARLKLLIRLKDKPMVIDADALNMLAAQKRWPSTFRANAVLTPHPGEMKRLLSLLPTNQKEVPTDDAGRLALATLAAQTFRCTILLKGHRTVITNGSHHHVNTTGDSSLSKAGTGDLLSGILASLLGQKMPPYDSAIAAAHLHGTAGELAGKRLGPRSVLASDVLDSLHESLSQYPH